MSAAAFGLTVLITALAGVAAVLSSRVSERLRIPAPAFFLVAAAATADVWPRLGGLSFTAVEQIVSLALAVILFDGGMRVGRQRLRTMASPTLWVGLAGTLATAGGVAVVAHLVIALDWRSALLLGAALAPTDPAVLFSVLGRREVAGRGGALLEGESGSNNPVGIALLTALLAMSGSGVPAAGLDQPPGPERPPRPGPVRHDPAAGDEAVVLSSGPDVAGLSALFTAPSPNAPQPGAWHAAVRGRDHGKIRARQAGLDGGEGWKAVGGHGGDGAGGGG